MNERRFMVRIERGDNPIMNYELLTESGSRCPIFFLRYN